MKNYIQLCKNREEIEHYMVDMYYAQPGMYTFDKQSRTLKDSDSIVYYITPDEVDKLRGLKFLAYGECGAVEEHENYKKAVEFIESRLV